MKVYSKLIILVSLFKGSNRVAEHSVTLFLAFFSYVVLPSFYLMADGQFRRDFLEKGLLKALYRAFAQNY